MIYEITSQVERAISNAVETATNVISSKTGIQLDYGPTKSKLFYEIQPQLEQGRSQIILTQKYSHSAIKEVLKDLGYKPTTKKPELAFSVVKK